MGRKRCGKRRNCSLTSNFSFSHSVFKRLVSQGRQKVSLCGNGLNYISFINRCFQYGNVLLGDIKGLSSTSLTVNFYPHFLYIFQCGKKSILFLKQGEGSASLYSFCMPVILVILSDLRIERIMGK